MSSSSLLQGLTEQYTHVFHHLRDPRYVTRAAQINRWLGGVTSPQREDEDVGPMSTLCDVLQLLRLGLGAATVKSRGKLHFVAKHFADVAAVEN